MLEETTCIKMLYLTEEGVDNTLVEGSECLVPPEGECVDTADRKVV